MLWSGLKFETELPIFCGFADAIFFVNLFSRPKMLDPVGSIDPEGKKLKKNRRPINILSQKKINLTLRKNNFFVMLLLDYV